MLTARGRLWRSSLAAFLWLLLRVPTDMVLVQCNRNDVLPYAISIQLLDFVIFTYLVYQLLQYRMRKPWRCPVCDGWGKRPHVPGMATEQAMQLTTCVACKGAGFIWEVAIGDRHYGN